MEKVTDAKLFIKWAKETEGLSVRLIKKLSDEKSDLKDLMKRVNEIDKETARINHDIELKVWKAPEKNRTVKW